MQQIRGRIRPFLGTKAFYASALSVMIPVTIQQLINNLFNAVDNLMVGSLDVNGLAMSAVTVANKPYIIFFGVFFGIMGAGGLMLSQYFGANDQKTCQGIFSLQMLLGLLNALLFTVVLFFFPRQIMSIFVKDERTVAMGIQYLKVVAFSYFPVAVSSTCIFSLRSLGKNRISMVVSLATMGMNAAWNYILMFGKLGFPALGVEGAAWGTVIARVFEMAFYLVLLLRKRMYFSMDLLAFQKLDRKVFRSFRNKAVPLVFNEILWTVGMNVFFWSYARINEAAVPAIVISELCTQIAAVMAMGTSSAVSVLIGTELGANELEKAKENCKKLFTLVVGIGLGCALLNIALGIVLPYAFPLSKELRGIATQLTCLIALFAPLNFMYGYCFYCLRAGGDTRNAALLDSGYMWAVPVPASLLIALFLPHWMPLFWAVLVVQVLMNAKIVLALRIVRKGKWIRNITLAAE